jgi:DUF4097 and DUF4098 domain-containing protein YvlB
MNAAMMLFVLAASPAPQSWKFKTGATPTVTVSNVDGSISVQAVPGEEVSVEATVVSGENDGWKVDVKQEGAEVHARACCGSCDSQQGNNCRSAKVDFVLRVPPGTRLKANAVSSDVSVDGLTGQQSIRTVSGKIDNRGSASSLEVHSVSGNVTLSPKALADTQVRTVSGDVHLNLPANPDAMVHLSTVSGTLNGKSVGVGKSMDASFGKGTVAMNIHTVSGSVEAQPGQ